MSAPFIDLAANLNNEDDDGFNWSLMRHAADPSVIVEGAVVVAGTPGFWSWVRVHRIDQDGQVVFKQIDANATVRLA